LSWTIISEIVRRDIGKGSGMFMKTIRSVAMGAALLGGALGAISSAQAGYIVTVVQEGTNVVATGSGTLDLGALTFDMTVTTTTGIIPYEALLYIGPATTTTVEGYVGITGPTAFGSGSATAATSGTGEFVGIAGVAFGSGQPAAVLVPEGYVSGTSLGTSTDTVSLRGRPPFRDWRNDRGLGLSISAGDGKCPQARLWAQVYGISVGTGRGQRS
jgi:hypothetical protein